jgi:hypothetical protein
MPKVSFGQPDNFKDFAHAREHKVAPSLLTARGTRQGLSSATVTRPFRKTHSQGKLNEPIAIPWLATVEKPASEGG